ncbi:hypothetical protein ACLOJK_030920 [Asimina triloba]
MKRSFDFISIFATAILLIPIISTSVSGHPFHHPPINLTSFSNKSRAGWDSFKQFAGCHMGDRVDGLAGLKDYLYHFGYIPTSPPSANFSDDFDDALHDALLTYQRNFNLNATGVLDASTVDVMVRPRCGVADVVNGSSTMNSAGDSGRKLYTFFPGTPRWPPSRRDLTYAFRQDALSVNLQTARTIFGRAFARWAAVTTLTFTETEDYESADMRIGFFSGDHGDGEPFDGVLGTLAHAFSPPSGRFHLDADENWAATDEQLSSSAIDLESVAVHEIGHLLGLGHSSVEDAIMYPTITAGTKRLELRADDIAGVQQLYGSNPNYNGTVTSSSTSSQSDRDASSSGADRRTRIAGGAHLMMVFLGVVAAAAAVTS